MLQSLTNKRHTLGQTVTALVVTAWLSLIFQTCAMAMMSNMELAAGNLATTLSSSQMADMADADHDNMLCCDLDTVDYGPIGSTSKTKKNSTPKAQPDDVITENTGPISIVALHVAKPPTLYRDQSLSYSTPHPTIEFCIWRK